MESDQVGPLSPVGLAFSVASGKFYVAEAGAQSLEKGTLFTMITPFSYQRGTIQIPAIIDDPLNMVFNDRSQSLLALTLSSGQLIEVRELTDGLLGPSSLLRHDIAWLGIQDPRGMTIDAVSGGLFILDGVGPRILRVQLDLGGGYSESQFSTIDLGPADLVGPHGIAFDPASGNLHVLDRPEHRLYELTQQGEVVATRDLSLFTLNDPQAMVFGPSSDQTDDPSIMNLFLADSGKLSQESSQSGRLLEFTFATVPDTRAAIDFTSKVVRATDTSLISPPSPDPSGAAYLPGSNTLIVSDGEVEEVVSGFTHFDGANVWELTLDGIPVNTANISTVPPTSVPMSDEPTGVAWNPANGHFYFSDDVAREVFDLDPGGDMQIGTSDDTWTSFDTLVVGSGDPEGITFDPNTNHLFVVDGVNQEVYEFTLSGNLISQFDVAVYGVLDPESVEYHAASNTLFILSSRLGSPIIIETTLAGALIQTIDISDASARNAAGLVIAPASDGSGPDRFYVVARGIDNNMDPLLLDGTIYEMTAPAVSALPPVASDDAALTQMDTAVMFDVAANDTDPNSNLDPGTTNTACGGCSTPANGSLTNHADGTFTYTPTVSYTGPDGFVYEICDTGALCDTATVTVTVTPPNVPPVANDDSDGTSEDFPVLINVAFNDTDGDGNLDLSTTNTLCIGCSNPGNGSLVNHADGTFTYDPSQDFNGQDVFIYEICDTYFLCDSATVTVTVGPIPDPPIAVDDSTITLGSTPVTIGAASNDIDPDFDLNPASVNTSCTGCSDPANGLLTNNGDGTFEYTPNVAFFGMDSFVYEICDGQPLCDTATVTVTVGEQFVIDSIYVSFNQGGNVGGVDFKDEDILLQDVISGTWEMYFDGSDVGIIQDVNAFYLKPDGTILLSIDVDATLPGIGPVSENDILHFIPTSLGPNTAGSFEFFLDGSDVDLTSTAEDIDSIGFAPDGRLVISTRGPGDIGGILTGDEDLLIFTPTSFGPNTAGTWEMYFDGSDVGLSDGTNEDVNAVWIGSLGDIYLSTRGVFSVTAVTGESEDVFICTPGSLGDTTSCTFSMFWDGSANGVGGNNVNGVSLQSQATAINDPPVAVDDDYTTDEDTTLIVAAPGVLGNDSDPELDPLTAVLDTDVVTGTLTLNPDGSFSYTPPLNFTGIQTFTYNANDGFLNSITATVTITMNAANDPPVAVDDEYTTAEDTTLNVAAPGVLGNDSDPELDPLTAVLNTDVVSGTLTLNPDGSFSYSPPLNFTGIQTFTYNANDGFLNSITATVTITVGGLNDPPIAVDDDIATDEDTTLNVAAPGVLGNDSDPEMDPLTAVLDMDVVSGILTLNPDGSFSYSPDPDFNGTDSFTYHANDGLLNSNSATVTITVNPINDAPMAENDSYTAFEEITLIVAAPGVLSNDDDIDGDLLTAIPETDPANGTLLLNPDGSFSYIPNEDFLGEDSFDYQVCDPGALCDTGTVEITVTVSIHEIYLSIVMNNTGESSEISDGSVRSLAKHVGRSFTLHIGRLKSTKAEAGNPVLAFERRTERLVVFAPASVDWVRIFTGEAILMVP